MRICGHAFAMLCRKWASSNIRVKFAWRPFQTSKRSSSLRKIMPDFGGIDFSPLVLLLLIQVASMLIGGARNDYLLASL